MRTTQHLAESLEECDANRLTHRGYATERIGERTHTWMCSPSGMRIRVTHGFTRCERATQIILYVRFTKTEHIILFKLKISVYHTSLWT